MPQSADVSELFKDKPEGSKRMSQNKEKEVLDFKATLLEVQKYGVLYLYHSVHVLLCDMGHSLVAAVSNLTGKSRRRREEEQILALGGKVCEPSQLSLLEVVLPSYSQASVKRCHILSTRRGLRHRERKKNKKDGR